MWERANPAGARESIELSYGRAAKIISVYIKTSVVIRNSGNGKLASVAHPPIDSILLERLKAKNKIDKKTKKWTNLEQVDYRKLISELEHLKKENSFWTIEEFWDPRRDKSK